jgi:hypothetical protein
MASIHKVLQILNVFNAFTWSHVSAFALDLTV